MTRKNSPTITIHEDNFEPPTRKITREQHINFKQQLLAKEDNNYDKLYFFPAMGDGAWREAGGHSALIYAYGVIKPLGRDIHFNPDDDGPAPHSSVGLMRIHGTTAVRKRLKKLKLYRGEQHFQNNTVFCLKRTFTQHDLDRFWEQEQQRRNQINTILPLKNTDPKLATLLTNTNKRLYITAMHKLGKFGRDTFGRQFVAQIRQLAVEMDRICNTTSRTRQLQGYKAMAQIVRSIIIDWQTIALCGIWQTDKCADLAMEYAKILDYLEQKITCKP